ncbi:hypothetical protein AAVH_40575 [Aphelenchoides avenae]|nr:hypothetical protein AAVH_40575 [Aphelenchus avenae]
MHRTGWEAKIAVLQSITVDFLKTTLGAALLGLVHPVPDVAAPKPSGLASVVSKLEKKRLNERQTDALRQILDPANTVIRMEAPASTGKTRTMVMACGALITLYPNARFIMTAETNKAGEKLIDEAASILKPQNSLAMLYVVSMAQELRGEFAQDHPVFVYGIIPHLKALIKQTEDSIRQKAKKKDAKAKEVGPLSLLELKKAKIFVAIKQADSRAPLDDAPMIELVLAKNNGIQLVVTTCSKLQSHKAMQACHTIFFDESSVSPDGDLLALASATGAKKVVAAGDRKQLKNHLQAGLEAFKAFGLRSLADIMADRAIAKHCELNEAYRPHPLIFEPWNLAVYEGSVQCRVRAQDRALITRSTFPLPKQGVPILLIHDRTSFTKGPAKSLSNETHETMAFRLIARLHCSVPKLKIAVICHYSDTRSKMKELMRIYDKRAQVTVTTIDGYEGQEQEAVIVITTRTSGSSNFVVDEKRTAAAITRARDFVAVIGDLDYLEAGALWSRYLVASVKLTPPVDTSYVNLICQKDYVSKYSETGRLLDKEGKPVTSSSVFAVQWVESPPQQPASGSKSA